MPTSATTVRLLDTAQTLVQQRGFNAFSYKDLAAEVGIRTASIHYHFPTKADLGVALMTRYHEGLERSLSEIERRHEGALARLNAFIGLYKKTQKQGTICLCGSLATDTETLPDALRAAVGEYLRRSEEWVARQITDGVASGELAFDGRAKDAASVLVAGLQGGLILARAQPKSPVIANVQRVFLATLGA